MISEIDALVNFSSKKRVRGKVRIKLKMGSRISNDNYTRTNKLFVVTLFLKIRTQ